MAESLEQRNEERNKTIIEIPTENTRQNPISNFELITDQTVFSNHEFVNDLLDVKQIQQGLETKDLGQNIFLYDSLPSTQVIAKELAVDFAKEGTMVISEEQTSGKGRMSRSWHSPKGAGLWFSFLLRPDVSLNQAPQLTLLCAVACAQAIEEVSKVVVHIKWPNDIYVNGKKVCGILTELVTDRNQIQSVIIGVGINVNQTAFPEELAEKATSLRLEAGRKVDRTKLLQTFCRQFEKLYETYLSAGFTPIKLLWEGYAISIGKEITARTPQGTFYGTALGIDEDGILQLQLQDGSIKQIYSADIEVND